MDEDGPPRPRRRRGAPETRSLTPAAPAGRPRRSAGLTATLLLLALTVAGCSFLNAGIRTSSALQNAGFQNVSLNITTGSGLPAGGVVHVSYTRGPTGNSRQDGQRAERVVWDSLPYRFGALVIIHTAGGCAGPVCATQSTAVASATYAGLAARYGPRPPGLSTTGAAGLSIPGWVIALLVALLAAVTAVTVTVVVMIVRRTRSRPGPPGGWHPMPGGPTS